VLLSETPSGAFVQAAIDGQGAVALRSDGGLAFWGTGASPTVAVKQGTFASAFGCIVLTDGSLRCFGSQPGQTVPPPTTGTFSQVELGGAVGCALGTDGKVRCFGDGSALVLTQAPAAEVFSRLALTSGHACGLRPDGTVRCWGSAVFGETTAPAGAFSDVAVKALRSCALDAAGALTCWGLPAGTGSLPPGPYRALRSTNFGRGMCGLLRDGGAVCEPTNLAQPTGPVLDVQAGTNQVCALGSDGGVSCVRGREELFGL
jgi:hypothetical protein